MGQAFLKCLVQAFKTDSLPQASWAQLSAGTVLTAGDLVQGQDPSHLVPLAPNMHEDVSVLHSRKCMSDHLQ